jgi:hypothetical protein
MTRATSNLLAAALAVVLGMLLVRTLGQLAAGHALQLIGRRSSSRRDRPR